MIICIKGWKPNLQMNFSLRTIFIAFLCALALIPKSAGTNTSQTVLATDSNSSTTPSHASPINVDSTAPSSATPPAGSPTNARVNTYPTNLHLLLGPASPHEIIQSDEVLAVFNAAQNSRWRRQARAVVVEDSDICHNADGSGCGTTMAKGGGRGKGGGTRNGEGSTVDGDDYESSAVSGRAALGDMVRVCVVVVMAGVAWEVVGESWF